MKYAVPCALRIWHDLKSHIYPKLDSSSGSGIPEVSALKRFHTTNTMNHGSFIGMPGEVGEVAITNAAIAVPIAVIFNREKAIAVSFHIGARDLIDSGDNQLRISLLVNRMKSRH